jgi:hypothetical protein
VSKDIRPAGAAHRVLRIAVLVKPICVELHGIVVRTAASTRLEGQESSGSRVFKIWRGRIVTYGADGAGSGRIVHSLTLHAVVVAKEDDSDD